MRTENKIKADLQKLVRLNHEKSEGFTKVQQRELDLQVKKLRQELSDFYSDGAKPCPKCGAQPIGMDRATKYEVGCVGCPPFLVNATTRQSYSSQGRTPAQAVENWNADVYIQDDKVDKV